MIFWWKVEKNTGTKHSNHNITQKTLSNANFERFSLDVAFMLAVMLTLDLLSLSQSYFSAYNISVKRIALHISVFSRLPDCKCTR